MKTWKKHRNFFFDREVPLFLGLPWNLIETASKAKNFIVFIWLFWCYVYCKQLFFWIRNFNVHLKKWILGDRNHETCISCRGNRYVSWYIPLVDSQGYHVSIIARNPFKMEKVMKRANSQKNSTLLYVDYTDGEKLRKAIRATIYHNGYIVLVVAWIHSIAEHALSIIMDEISKGTYEWK